MGSGYTACGKVTAVFGVKVCVTTDAFQKNKSKCEHVVNVFYQLLDNNADGFVDDAAVHNEMVRNNYLLFVPNTETESERAVKLANGNCGWGYRGLEGSFVRQVRRTVRLRRQDLRCQLYHRRGDLLGIRFLHRRTVHEGTSYRCST